MIEKTILAEENRFDAVLREGLPRLEAEIAKALDSTERVLPGDVAFQLYDTFGVPYDFVEDTATTQNVRVDREGYDRAMEAQRGKARAGSAFGGGKKAQEFELPGGNTALQQAGDRFEGYATTQVDDATVVAVFDEGRHAVDAIGEDEAGYVALDRTPFYLESGGQVSDTGQLVAPSDGAAVVDGMTRIAGGLPRAHHVHVTSGRLRLGDTVRAEVDARLRDATRRNHTGTHLLHAALREVLGTHVKQAGSLVAPDRLRFDFVHFQPVTREEIARIERIVNGQIYRNAPVTTEVRSTEEAIASGAMALFGEKYGDKVRVVSIPGFSVELCGGTHVSATGDIGFFLITSESGVAAGVRRIEALTGAGAVEYAQGLRSTLAEAVASLSVPQDKAVDAIEKLQAESKRLAREVTQLKTKMAMGGGAGATTDDTVQVNGVTLARRKVADLDKDALRGLADSLKARITSGVVVLAAANDGKVQIVVAVTPDLTARIKAGAIVKEIAPIVGGGGGGRPDFAEAGGKLPEKIDEMLTASEAVLQRMLS
jgi:alanyl-tRNA synthetase